MGLSLRVGFLAEIIENEPGEAESLRSEFRSLNKILLRTGLKEHLEPEAVAPADQFDCDMIGYCGLHYVRRIGTYLALGQDCPDPGPPYSGNLDEADFLSRQQKYTTLFEANEEHLYQNPKISLIGRLFGRAPKAEPKEPYLPFMHLIMHGDSDGIYVPQEFRVLRLFEPQATRLGMVIGSTQTLLEECQLIAKAIGIPENAIPDDEEFVDLVDSQGQGELPWQRYGIEAFGCLNLLKACEASLKTGAALVFS
jgi:hypothetical protein